MTRVLSEVSVEDDRGRWTYRIIKTPWRSRLIVWPGEPFRTWPFPYLFHRYEVQALYPTNDYYGRQIGNYLASFYRLISASRYMRKLRNDHIAHPLPGPTE